MNRPTAVATKSKPERRRKQGVGGIFRALSFAHSTLLRHAKTSSFSCAMASRARTITRLALAFVLAGTSFAASATWNADVMLRAAQLHDPPALAGVRMPCKAVLGGAGRAG